MTDHSQLSHHLSDLWCVDETERNKAIKLLFKIFNKILSNLNEPKFRDLNYNKIRAKFNHARPGYYILFDAGFKQSMNGTRLQFAYNDNNLVLLNKVNDALQQRLNEPNSQQSEQKVESKQTEWRGNKYQKQSRQI